MAHFVAHFLLFVMGSLCKFVLLLACSNLLTLSQIETYGSVSAANSFYFCMTLLCYVAFEASWHLFHSMTRHQQIVHDCREPTSTCANYILIQYAFFHQHSGRFIIVMLHIGVFDPKTRSKMQKINLLNNCKKRVF